MAFNIGDRVIYEGEDIDGVYLQGKIVDIAKNSRDIITSYFAVLDSGLYVQFKPHNLRWSKIEESNLVS
jgi:hypothetical protein